MKRDWVKYLCDPIDKSELVLTSFKENKDGFISSGILKSKGGSKYKIKNGVPILLTSTTQNIESVGSFNYEWNEFDFDYGREGWEKEIVKPIVKRVDYFKGKVIVDCGAGSGRQSCWMLAAGAKFVFCLELSDSAGTIVSTVNAQFKNKIFVIQADIANLPLNVKKIKADLVYCVNVIQHTENPVDTLHELSKIMSKKTEMIFNIYLYRGRYFWVEILNIVRWLTKIISFDNLKNICFIVTVIFYPLSKIPFFGKAVSKFFPISHSFKETWLCLYDLLGSHRYQKFYTSSEVGKMFKDVSLKIMKKTKYAYLLRSKASQTKG